jgi:hypothetical protein
MNGKIESDVIEYLESDVFDYLVDCKFKRFGNTLLPSIEEWRQERDRRRKGWSRIIGEQEAAYRAELQHMSVSALGTPLRERKVPILPKTVECFSFCAAGCEQFLCPAERRFSVLA